MSGGVRDGVTSTCRQRTVGWACSPWNAPSEPYVLEIHAASGDAGGQCATMARREDV